jgi:hypothetical protein
MGPHSIGWRNFAVILAAICAPMLRFGYSVEPAGGLLEAIDVRDLDEATSCDY